MLQSHRWRDKHWLVIAGTAELQLDGKVRKLAKNDSVMIPHGAIHSLRNAGSDVLDFIEVQTGDRLDEKDFVQHEGTASAA